MKTKLRLDLETAKAMTLPYFSLSKGSASLVATIALLVIVFSVLNPRFASLVNFYNILAQASVPLIIVVGLTMVILLGSIDLSVVGIMGAVGMAWILLSPDTRNEIDLGIWAWVIALSLGFFLGLVSGAIYAKLKVPSFIVTLGMWNVGLGLASLLYGSAMRPSLTSDVLAHWPSALTFGLPNGFWLAAFTVIVGVLLIRFSHLGRETLAIGNNEPIAGMNGIRVVRVKIMVFAFAGLTYGLAGIVATMELGSGSPTIGSGLLFLVIPAVIIGGTPLTGGEGGVLRSTLGVFLLTILNNGLLLVGVDPHYQSAVFGAILVVALVLAAWPHRHRLKVAK